MNLAQLLVRAARVHPERTAVLLGDRPQWTYRELADRTSRLAGHLRDGLGLQPGDRVAVYMTNHVAYLEVLYAAWWAGLAVVPINAKLHPREVEFILGDAGAAVLFVSDDLAADLQPLLGGLPALRRAFTPGDPAYETALAAPSAAPAHRAPDDLAWLFYTSGTTGRPKGVMQTHRNLYAMTSCYFIDVDDVQADDAIVYAAPMSHGAGMYNFAFVARAARHIVPASGGFDPAELVALSQSVGRLCLFAAPTMVKRLVEHPDPAAVPGLRTIVYGGGPMYVADCKAALARFGNVLVQIYGQGESPMTISCLPRAMHADTAHPRHLERLASVGPAFTGVEVRVADAEDNPLPPGEIGEVLVHGDTVMAGYWNNPAASAETLRNGWLHTGDVGSMDADGFLTLKDRSKDVIISGGSNIYPREVEEVLLRHLAVSEVSVVGQADAEWGEIVIAFVVPRGTAPDTAELDALCLDHIARFKRPKRYVMVEALPKNNTGKVLKTRLRELLA